MPWSSLSLSACAQLLMPWSFLSLLACAQTQPCGLTSDHQHYCVPWEASCSNSRPRQPAYKWAVGLPVCVRCQDYHLQSHKLARICERRLSSGSEQQKVSQNPEGLSEGFVMLQTHSQTAACVLAQGGVTTSTQTASRCGGGVIDRWRHSSRSPSPMRPYEASASHEQAKGTAHKHFTVSRSPAAFVLVSLRA